MNANASGVVTQADVAAAQVLLDALADEGLIPELAAGFLTARGVVAGWSADVRTAGYLDGVQRGRQEAAHVVLDALRDEGLAP